MTSFDSAQDRRFEFATATRIIFGPGTLTVYSAHPPPRQAAQQSSRRNQKARKRGAEEQDISSGEL
jgi:hypothetical protein